VVLHKAVDRTLSHSLLKLHKGTLFLYHLFTVFFHTLCTD